MSPVVNVVDLALREIDSQARGGTHRLRSAWSEKNSRKSFHRRGCCVHIDRWVNAQIKVVVHCLEVAPKRCIKKAR